MLTVKQSIEKFIRDESDFSTTLQDIVQKMENPAIHTQTIINPYILIGRIDLIYRYHKFQFMPGLLNIGKEIIVEYIVEHKMLLEMYKEILKRQAIVNLLDVTPDLSPEIKEILKCLGKSTTNGTNIFRNALDRYIALIRAVRDSTLKKSVSSRCNCIINKVQNLLDDATPQSLIKNTDIKYTAAIIVEEIMFLRKFQETMNIAEYHTVENIWGKFQNLVKVKMQILNELKNCIDDYDLLDTANCYIKNIKSFNLYVEHFKAIDMEKIETKAKQHNDKLKNIYNLPLEHLATYKHLLDECIKTDINKKTHIKLKQLQDTVENVLNEVNAIIIIAKVISPKIDIAAQGHLRYCEVLLVTSLKNHFKRDAMKIYLFDKSLIFTKTKNYENMFYCHHILTDIIKRPKKQLITDYEMTIETTIEDKDVYNFYADDSKTINKFYNSILNVLSNI